MKIIICLFIMVMCWGCLSKAEKIKRQYSDNRKDFQQELQMKNFRMVTGVFIKPENDDFEHNKDLIFKTRIMLDKQQLENDKNLSTALQFGIDSAFFLRNQQSIIWPAYVMPVANGQPLNPEFIVAFEREKLSALNEIEFKAAINGLSTIKDSGIVFNLTKINRLYK